MKWSLQNRFQTEPAVLNDKQGMHRMITSADNARVREVIRLNTKAKERREQRSFVCEGKKLFLETPAELRKMVFVSESFEKEEEAFLKNCAYEVVSDRVFRKMCDTQTPQGILTIAGMPEYSRDELIRPRGGSNNGVKILLLEDVQDPGNVGTILRTAEAAGVSGVFLSMKCADPFQPKVIRATMGSVFRVPFREEPDLVETAEWLKRQHVRLLAAELRASKEYHIISKNGKRAWILGNEGNGISEKLLACADERIHIPMFGKVESLNVAIAAAILLFDK